jgi:methylenetetrahydrofolate dehydrogenase (NADP+)/methenyltetrahydrofolate cyclohydrolase
MAATILNGVPLKDRIFAEVRSELGALGQPSLSRPCIAFIAVVGHERLLNYTIAMHRQAAEALGFAVRLATRPASVTEAELCEVAAALSRDESVHAVVLLQPLPPHIDAIRVISRIDPSKEVEGFHPANVAGMLAGDFSVTRAPMVLPTALLELFRFERVEPASDSHWVFVVDDEFFARPFTNMVVRTACVRVVPDDNSSTIVNSGSRQLAEHCRKADFLIVVSKQVGFLRPEWLKPGVCVVDVYSNLVKEVPSKADPAQLVPVIRGGVDAASIADVAGQVAPCPGGLMPVVLAVLLRNCLAAYVRSATSVRQFNLSNAVCA